MALLTKYAVALVLEMLAVAAHAKLYQHVNPVTGDITYSNFPMPKREPKAISSFARTPAQVPYQHSYRAPKAAPRNTVFTTSTAANFPRITVEMQKERDLDRRKILYEELESEQSALNEASARNEAEESLQRLKANIDALQREISNIR